MTQRLAEHDCKGDADDHVQRSLRASPDAVDAHRGIREREPRHHAVGDPGVQCELRANGRGHPLALGQPQLPCRLRELFGTVSVALPRCTRSGHPD